MRGAGYSPHSGEPIPKGTIAKGGGWVQATGISPNLVRVLAGTAPNLLAEMFVAGKVLEAEVLSVFQGRAMLSFGKGIRLEVALQAMLKEGQKLKLQVQPREQGSGLVLNMVEQAPQQTGQGTPPRPGAPAYQPGAPTSQPPATAQGQTPAAPGQTPVAPGQTPAAPQGQAPAVQTMAPQPPGPGPRAWDSPTRWTSERRFQGFSG